MGGTRPTWEKGEIPEESRFEFCIAHHRNAPFEVPFVALYQRDRRFLDYLAPKFDEGWKLHVPITESFVITATFRHVLECLRGRQVPHKFVFDPESMIHMEHGRQRGKFLTIYTFKPTDRNEEKPYKWDHEEKGKEKEK